MTNQDSWMFNKGQIINFPIPEGIQIPIYVIGDSHVRVLPEAAPHIFMSSQKDIEELFISKTAYAIGTEGHREYLDNALSHIPDGSMILLSFGEIDCRHYVPKKSIENRTTIEYQVNVIFDRYTKNCICGLKNKFKLSILGAYMCPDDHTNENKYEDILEAKTLLNIKLERYCELTDILFIPIFKKVLDEKWDECKLDYPNYFNDSSHLGPCMIPTILNSMSNYVWKT